ncbi:MAG TPA: hypothetical protein VF808_00195 [Ktedonobacterales bacterium]
MFAARSAQYWLWFLLLGVVSTLVDYSSGHSLGSISSESLWLLLGGLAGIIAGVFASLSRPYDLLIGLLFLSIGVIGILHNFGVILVSQNTATSHAFDGTAVLGLSLSLPYALIHSLLGLTSLTQGIRLGRATSSVVVNTPVGAEA